MGEQGGNGGGYDGFESAIDQQARRRGRFTRTEEPPDPSERDDLKNPEEMHEALRDLVAMRWNGAVAVKEFDAAHADDPWHPSRS